MDTTCAGTLRNFLLSTKHERGPLPALPPPRCSASFRAVFAPRTGRLALALALLGLAACSRCGTRPAPAPEEPEALLPAPLLAAAEVPHLAALGDHLHALARLKLASLAAQLTGQGDPQAFFA